MVHWEKDGRRGIIWITLVRSTMMAQDTEENKIHWWLRASQVYHAQVYTVKYGTPLSRVTLHGWVICYTKAANGEQRLFQSKQKERKVHPPILTSSPGELYSVYDWKKDFLHWTGKNSVQCLLARNDILLYQVHHWWSEWHFIGIPTSVLHHTGQHLRINKSSFQATKFVVLKNP